MAKLCSIKFPIWKLGAKASIAPPSWSSRPTRRLRELNAERCPPCTLVRPGLRAPTRAQAILRTREAPAHGKLAPPGSRLTGTDGWQ